MRDPKRIQVILKLVQKFWEANPDLRLCQLLGNCFEINDLYHVEDDDLILKLIQTYKKR